MKLILIEDVPNLGYKDDVVEVKAGYGRNYLIPQLKAVIATPSALKVLAENQRQRAHKLAQIKAEAEAAAAALEGVSLSIAVKTAATGTIYGAVNAATVSEATPLTASSSQSRTASRKWAATPPLFVSTRKYLLNFPWK